MDQNQALDILLDNEYIVYSIINKYNGYKDKEDLYQVGMMGLQKALQKYVPNKECKFSSYAYKYVLGEVTEYMRSNNSLKISRETIKQKQKVNKTRDLLRQKLAREPTSLEIALVLDMEESDVITIENIQGEIRSLDYEFSDTEYNLYNSIKVEDQETKPEIMDLKVQLEQLNKDEQELIYSRYFVQLTQSETSKHLGISQAKVSRKEAKILQKLKTKL